MWKRWSSKSMPAANLSPASEGDKVKATSPTTAACDPVALEPSVEQETVDQDRRRENMTEGATGISISFVQLSMSQPVVGELEQGRSPASQAPVLQNSSANTVQEKAGGVNNKDAQAPVVLHDGPLLNSSIPPNAPPFHKSAKGNEAVRPEPIMDEITSNAETDMGFQAERNVTHMFTPANTLSAQSDHPHIRTRRLSFRSLAFFGGRDKQSLPISCVPSSPILKSKLTDHLKSKSSSSPKPKLSRSEKHALSSAIALRILIVGPGSVPSSSAGDLGMTAAKLVHSKSPPFPNLKKLKSRLLKSKSANAVISQLRRLPLPDGPSFHVSGTSSESLVTHPDAGGAPIHAVCLASTDEEADEKHFSRLRTSHTTQTSGLSPDAYTASSSQGHISVGTASLESLIPVLRDLRLVSLLASPDLGFGQPASDNDDTGILAGSVPSAGAVVDGFEEITKQLMSLGFATSKTVFPSHAGIYPPEDRMSVLTYWWGLELVLPEPSIIYLGKAKSISNSVLNFLSALALFNNGVREVLPFIRYVANFVDFEWTAIRSQDKGRGVVCAATWVMPAAMVPRPWDFPSRTAKVPTVPSVAPASGTIVKDSKNGDARRGRPSMCLPPQESYPLRPLNDLDPPAPVKPTLPQLVVTPATLPRGSNVPQPEQFS